MIDPLNFNGTITIKNTKTGNHRTFQIKTQKDDASFAPGRRIISLLSGSDNESDFVGFAFIHSLKDEKGDIFIWVCWNKKDTRLFRTYCDMLKNQSKWEAKGCTYHLEKRCRRCNRKLTTPESIESGIGPVCIGKE